MPLRRTPFLVALLACAASLHSAPSLAVGGSYYGGSHNDTPRQAAPSYTRAESYVAQRDYDAATRELSALVQAEPRNADAWNLLGYSSRRLRNYVAADAAYARALDLNPNHLGALEYQGELFILMRRYDAAKANLTRLFDLCGACEEHGDLQQALVRAGQSATGAKRLKAPGS
ncbi:Beta-barrel assembly-enhancing protease [Defluviimonas aquaemixtae]|uniref:Beta-barrel assembly-enhancing protease n=1 Tax=Albidovulum aquaemixtae TaxID=1542388 RepID=A0A2R8BM27_9RHOB|nr:tetratricopeptide repeat protein [Defluviimonas aquaemixtae]SPH24470.1 Beta-barrel assembly-enhancing protease [Defluviimonas aquaemixtae]